MFSKKQANHEDFNNFQFKLEITEGNLNQPPLTLLTQLLNRHPFIREETEGSREDQSQILKRKSASHHRKSLL